MIAAVIVAAGSGERLGAGMPKALVELGGRPMLDWSLRLFFGHSDVDQVVVVAPPSHRAAVTELVESRALVVDGGSHRPMSVRSGLAAISDEANYVLVHDAARPLVPAAVVSRVVAELRAGSSGGVIPAVPVVDTVKEVARNGMVTGTVDRSSLRSVQTPQGFNVELLRSAYAEGDRRGLLTTVTDDASLLEELGHPVQTVEGAPESFKITTAHDLRLAEALVAAGALS